MANPIVRDFNASRARAATQSPSSRPFSIEIEPGQINRRHNTISQTQDPATSRHNSVASLPSLHKRINRSNTIREYHANVTPVRPQWEEPGAEPGVDPLRDALSHFSLFQQPCQITVVDFSDDRMQKYELDNQGLIDFLQQPREEWVSCRWINVNGISWDVIRALGQDQKLHRLAIEDLLSTGSRTKADFYQSHSFVLLTLQKLVRLQQNDSDSDSEDQGSVSKKRKRWWNKFTRKKDSENVNGIVLSPKLEGAEKSPDPSYVLDSMLPVGDRTFRSLQRFRRTANPERAMFMERNSALTKKHLAVSVEQVSIFHTENNTVISLFEHSADDIEEPILKRLESKETILRRSAEGSMMLQAVIDAIIDLAIPVTAAYEDVMGELELDVLTDPSIERSRQLYILSSELSLLRSNMQPIANVISALRDHSRTDTNAISAQTQSQRLEGAASTTTPKKPVKSVPISPIAHTYFGDVEDNVVMLTQNLDIMRRTTNDMIDLTYNQMGAFQNESMKQLAAVTIFFLPLTFLTGYFGQNFHTFDALNNSDAYFWEIAIPVCFAVMLVLMRAMLWRWWKRIVQRVWISRARKARREKKGAWRRLD